MTRSTPRAPWRALLLLALSLFLSAPARAQGGAEIRGTVAGADGRAVPNAQVAVVGTRRMAVTNQLGAFALARVPAGTYQLRVSAPGFRTGTQAVTVRDGEPALAAIALVTDPVQLDGVVVSASRRSERITDAPATITHIGSDVLENSVGNSFAGALKNVKGLDFIQTGMTTIAINARGFNSSFNNRMLMLEDGRISVLPENGLPVGQLTATPKVDLAGMEVLVGPGSSLYGPDASNGVLALTTKDPRQYPGLTVEASGGTRQYADLQARYAGVRGNLGYKVSGEWQQADDWSNTLAYGAIDEDNLKIPIDWHARVGRGTAGLTYYMGANKVEVSGGYSLTDGVGQTNVGRNQLRNWGYNFQQARFSTPHIFVNAYRAQSKSGESFALNRYAAAQLANGNLSADSLRMLSDWPSDGRMYAAEFQHNVSIPQLLGTELVWGAQYRRDVVSSDRQWLTDRLTGSDVSIRQVGTYAQTTTPVMPWLDVVLSARLDDHENYDRQFSPKAGVVFKPMEGQALRLTYNRAFKSPTLLQTNFFIPDWTSAISIFGNTRGFTVQNAAGTTVASYDPLEPESNTTWEVGYKGVFNSRLFVDVAGYSSRYEHFLSPLVVISNPFGGAAATFAYDADGKRLLNNNGVAPITLIYYNLGAARLHGMDGGVNYVIDRHLAARGNVSLLQLDKVEVPAGREEATSLNAPATKFTVGLDFNDVPGPHGTFQGGASLRHVNRYYFRSGINMGQIPNFTGMDFSLGYRMPQYHSLINLNVANAFSCVGNFTYASSLPATDPRRNSDPLNKNPISEDRSCGFNKRHSEMIKMPEVGTMVFLGVQFQTR